VGGIETQFVDRYVDLPVHLISVHYTSTTVKRSSIESNSYSNSRHLKPHLITAEFQVRHVGRATSRAHIKKTHPKKCKLLF